MSGKSEWIDQLLGRLKGKVELLVAEWDEMGIQAIQLNQRKEYTEKHIVALLDEMIQEETLSKLEMKERILKLENRLQQMSEELEVTVKLHKTNESLVLWEEILANEISKFDEKRLQRKKELEDAQSEEKLLCDRLEEAVVSLNNPDRLIPSLSDIKLVKDHVTNLKTEKHRRLVCLVEYQSLCVKHCLKLEMPEGDPDSQFCQELVAKDALNYISLSTETMEEAIQLEQSLNKRVIAIKDECDSIRGKLHVLWERLNTPESERIPFRDATNAPPNSPSDLYLLRCELDRLQELKRVNMGQFIASCRLELRRWWDYCHVEDRYRQFPGLFDNDYSEELLQDHENEIKRWKDYYTRNEVLLQSIEEWNALFTQLMDAERKMKDPTILKNRGGILLKITNERKQLNQQLQKLEKRISSHLGEHADEEDIPVTFNGRIIPDHITHCWSQLTEQKENEKKSRQNKATKLIEQECRFGVSRSDLKRKPPQFGSVMNITVKPKEPPPAAKLQKFTHDDGHASAVPRLEMNVSQFSSYSEFTRGIPNVPTSSRGRSSSTMDSGISSSDVPDKRHHH